MFLTGIVDYHLHIRRAVNQAHARQSRYLSSIHHGNYEEHVENQSPADGSLQSEAEIYAVSSITGCQTKVAVLVLFTS